MLAVNILSLLNKKNPVDHHSKTVGPLSPDLPILLSCKIKIRKYFSFLFR